MSNQPTNLRIPEALRNQVEAIFALTDEFCSQHLDAEYAELCRKLVAKLARKRPSPLLRGDLRIWAGAAIYTVGNVNFLFDRSQSPHLSAGDLSNLIGSPQRTLADKSKLIRDLLNIDIAEPEFCRRKLLKNHPYAYLVQMKDTGFIVDARTLPPEVQLDFRRRGIIPDLPAQ